MDKALMTFYAATSLHPGAGSATSAIDLPVQRESHTDFPTISGSGLKGALRQEAGVREMPQIEAVFGPDTNEQNKYAGALLVGDAKLLALPVRSLQSVFYWATCPLVLARLERDLEQFGIKIKYPTPDKGQAFVPEGNDTRRLVLEELDFEVRTSRELGELLGKLLPLISEHVGAHFRSKLGRDFVVLNDEDFSHLARTGMQVSARVQLDENKTSNNLWYEETIPSETILWSLLLARPTERSNGSDPLDLLATTFDDGRPVQVGGNETTGQGWCYTRITRGNSR